MDELKEGIKETIRTAILAAIPLVIIDLQAGKIDYKAVAVAIVISLLRGLEKLLHEADVKVVDTKGWLPMG